MPLSVVPSQLSEPAITVDPTMALRWQDITGRSIGETHPCSQQKSSASVKEHFLAPQACAQLLPAARFWLLGRNAAERTQKNLAESATALYRLRKTTIAARERMMEIQKRLWPVRNAA
jgi:hypothetical protein